VGVTPLTDSQGTPKILMCPPEFFTVTYTINPWMAEALDAGSMCDVELAKKQWETLYNTLTQEAGADVLLQEPVDGLPDLVFTANAAFVYGNKAIIAHYKYPERQGEEPHDAAWFRAHGFETITLPEDIYFEGAGDALIYQDRVFAGYKTRTDIVSHNLITAETGLPVLSMELVHDKFYHIDVCLCPLSDGYFIYSPDAFDAYGRTVIEANIPEEKRIPVAPEEAARFACNAVNVNDVVVFNQGSPQLIDALKEKGFRPIPVDLSEFIKAGGSAKCLTLRVG
jgi:N-dimethylarginine dimethylaminohydrolase